jgi:hypothetical protein
VRGDAGEPRFSELARGSALVTALLEVCSSAMLVRASTTGRVGGHVTLGRAVRGDIALAAGATADGSTNTGALAIAALGSPASWIAATGC